MKEKSQKILFLLFLLSLGVSSGSLFPCTNILVTKGASQDRSTMVTYSADSHTLYGELQFIPAGRHIAGSLIDVYERDSGKFLGRIRQVAQTYTVIGDMNEYQVVIGETTFGGREELVNPKGIIDYGSLMTLALQRSKTARQAIDVMAGLVSEYGYCSAGESFSIADANEVWILEMIGKGPGNPGAAWAAYRIPDGYICAHANQARIRAIAFNDKANCRYAPDVVSFAREKGYFKGEDKDFSFADTYAPLEFGGMRFCEARVWNIFRRVTLGTLPNPMDAYKDYAMGHNPNHPMPLFVKPDRSLSVRDVMELMRDHFEGTEFDMTQDVGAGPFILPYRWRPLTWKVDNVEYCNERAVSTQQTGYSWVSQSRGWLPAHIGGVFWFGVDDTYSTVYVPIYCGVRSVPKAYAKGAGNFSRFSWDSAFWVFNFVANFAYSRYMDTIQDIQKVQRELEGKFMDDQVEIDKAALAIYDSYNRPQKKKTAMDQYTPLQVRDYLTAYSCEQGEMTVQRWRQLGEFLIWKYLDGNVRDELGNVTHPPYPDAWYKRIVKEKGEFLKVVKEPQKK